MAIKAVDALEKKKKNDTQEKRPDNFKTEQLEQNQVKQNRAEQNRAKQEPDVSIQGFPFAFEGEDSGPLFAGKPIVSFFKDSFGGMLHQLWEFNRGLYNILLEQLARDGTRIYIRLLLDQIGPAWSIEQLIDLYNRLGLVSGWGRAELLEYNPLSFRMRIRVMHSWEVSLQTPGRWRSSAYLRGHWAAMAEGMWSVPCQAEEHQCGEYGDCCAEFLITRADAPFGLKTPEIISDSEYLTRKNLELALEEQARELAESEEKYRILVEYSPNYVFIIQDNRVLYANSKALELFGDWDLNGPIKNTILNFACPEYRELITMNLAKRFQGEEVPDYEIEAFDHSGKRLQLMVKSKMVQYRGRPALEGILVDLTETRSAEKQAGLLFQAINQTADAVGVCDLDGKILFLNKSWAEMHQLTVDECQGNPISIFHTPKEFKRIFPLLNQVKNKGGFQGEVEHLRRDGTTFFSWLAIGLLKDEQDRPYGFIGIARDMTKIKDMERREIQTEKLITAGLLASGLAHEINNPLTGIYSSAQLLERELGDLSQKKRKHLNNILKCSERIQNLVSRFLSIARPAGEIACKEININPLIEHALTLSAHLLTPEMKVKKILAPDLPAILGDPDQIMTMLSNLIVNSLQALKIKGSTLTVETKMAKPNGITIRIHDNGPGIPENHIKHVFEPFYTTKSEARGTGLGLYIVSTVVGQHNGTVEVKSKEGEFTEFIVNLPREAAA